MKSAATTGMPRLEAECKHASFPAAANVARNALSKFNVIFTRLSCVSVICLFLLLQPNRVRADACALNTEFSLNGVCASCPDPTMQALGQSSCPFTAYSQLSTGSPSPIIYEYSLIGVSQIQVDGFGSKGGDALGVSPSVGGDGGRISAKLPVSNIDRVAVVMGSAPDLRSQLFAAGVIADPTAPESLASRILVAGEGGWGTSAGPVGRSGGLGGTISAGNGGDSSSVYLGGVGGDQVAGGTSPGSSLQGASGTLGYGGAGYVSSSSGSSGGRGGNGYYGGGGGGASSGGGGGSSYAMTGSEILLNQKGVFSSTMSRLYITVISCNAGYYLKNNACVSCPAGYSTPTSNTTGADSSVCTVCAGGYTGTSANEGTSGCSLCSPGTYSAAGNNMSCITCVPNKTGCGTSAGFCEGSCSYCTVLYCTVLYCFLLFLFVSCVLCQFLCHLMSSYVILPCVCSAFYQMRSV